MRKFFVLISCLAVSMLGVAVADDTHQEHAKHGHEHAEKCGHKKEQHGDHEDYVHGDHHHKKHEGHYDECEGDGPHAPAKSKAKKKT